MKKHLYIQILVIRHSTQSKFVSKSMVKEFVCELVKVYRVHICACPRTMRYRSYKPENLRNILRKEDLFNYRYTIKTTSSTVRDQYQHFFSSKLNTLAFFGFFHQCKSLVLVNTFHPISSSACSGIFLCFLFSLFFHK